MQIKNIYQAIAGALEFIEGGLAHEKPLSPDPAVLAGKLANDFIRYVPTSSKGAEILPGNSHGKIRVLIRRLITGKLYHFWLQTIRRNFER